jgi:hypothetical protein
MRADGMVPAPDHDTERKLHVAGSKNVWVLDFRHTDALGVEKIYV